MWITQVSNWDLETKILGFKNQILGFKNQILGFKNQLVVKIIVFHTPTAKKISLTYLTYT